MKKIKIKVCRIARKSLRNTEHYIHDALQDACIRPRCQNVLNIHTYLEPDRNTKKNHLFSLRVRHISAPYPAGVGMGVGSVGLGVGAADGGAVSPHGGMHRHGMSLEQLPDPGS